jgi:hypothetical protein
MSRWHVPLLVRLTGRGADGERNGGRRIHVLQVLADDAPQPPRWGKAVCGAIPGRLSNGWVEVDGPEVPTCPRCQQKTRRP